MISNIESFSFPVRISIEFETEQELCDLLCRLNLVESVVNEHQSGYKYPADDTSSYSLWDKLDDLVVNLGLREEL